MTIEVFAALAMIIMVISIIINIILLLRIEVMTNFIRFLKMSAAVLYSELQETKNQHTQKDARNIPTNEEIR